MVYVKGLVGGMGLLLAVFFAQIAYQMVKSRPQQIAITPSVAFNPVSVALTVAVFALGFGFAARYW